ncbi:Catechol O-methyltransferase domain-containing protein 1 [Desmophyllum pertusum]|uniref:Catechol O-methyltransferase domain-containing protein 1 n=1 Tax=Desmophyllum pertusum TaxID=174260 RepID=A0A9X0CQC4_9CNID|nr:Catechol O-methyltransferase domain-containing protein 1 [Desmophyllum pertusum]
MPMNIRECSVVCEKLNEFKQKATPANQTSFIAQLATAIGAKKVLEVGTFVGITSLSIALALPEDGQMVTIDFNDDWLSTGRPIWTKAGVSHKIKPIVKDAAQALDDMIANGEAGTFDMIYIDADKWSYHVYYEKCVELVKKGGLILLDDSSSFAVGYLLGRIRGSKTLTAEDYMLVSANRENVKRTEGFEDFSRITSLKKTFSSPEHPAVTDLREGTFVGTTSLSIALALPEDGQMVTIDFNDDWLSTGRPIWTKAGVSHKIKPIVKDASQALDDMIANGEAGTFDMIYIDADKWSYHVYYEKCIELVKKGGLILIDDVLWLGFVFDPKMNKDGKTWEAEPVTVNTQDPLYDDRMGERITVHVHALNKKIVKDSRVMNNILPIGNGLSVATKL